VPPSKKSQNGRPKESPRSKRSDILRVATETFGRDGYEYSKWADVAKAVGIGSTALYHYFESKLHALYEIQGEAVQSDAEKFARVVAEHDDFEDALVAVLNAAFDLTEHEVLRNRVLVAEQALAGLHRTSPREEESRQRTRSRMRDLEFAWATFLTRGMDQGVIPEADARLLTRAMLGLYNSVWHWYRPGGDLSLADVRDFYVARILAVAGLPLAAAEKPAKLKPSSKAGKRPRKAAA
jgi:AcrR family transcriptional regulator